MEKYKRMTERGVPCSVASHAFGGRHEQYYYRLAELEDKIEDGMFIELPCKLGTTVYCLCKGNYVLVGKKTGWIYDIKEFKFTLSVFGTWEYGETLFLSREEAEIKLKEL